MWKAQRAKKLENKYSNKTCRILVFVLYSLALTTISFSQEEFQENLHKPIKESPQKKEAADYQEKLIAANFDYQEKLFGQALDIYKNILANMENDLSEDQIIKIKLKMAHCHFELGQYYKATTLLDPLIGLDTLPIEFQENNFESNLITFQEFQIIIKKSPSNDSKPITELFPHLISNTELTQSFMVEAFNKILNSPSSCNKLINAYGNIKTWKNNLIYLIPKNGTEHEQKLLSRLILEALYPFKSYLSNQLNLTDSKKKDDIKVLNKNHDYYEALYWRSRINLETTYFSYAISGFEEILTTLNFRDNERLINCLFYKAKSKFLLNQFRIALKELENFNSLYGIDEYYKLTFFDETYFLIGRCFYELSKFDKAIQKFVTITSGYDNREPRNKLIRNAYFWLGESYYCKGQLNEAIKSYQVIVEYGTYEEKENAIYSLGWALNEKGDHASHAKAKEQFNVLLKNYPNTDYRLKAELKLAEIEIEEGNSEKAEKILSELTTSNANETFLLKNENLIKQTEFLIGLLYIKKKDYNKALMHFKKSEDTLDTKLKQKINLQFGLCYKALGDYKKAISFFTIASEMNTNENYQVISKSYAADTYYEKRTHQSDLEYASKIFDDLINQYPNHELNIEWRKKKANVLRQQNREDEAISTLNKILEENHPEWEFAQVEIGNILMTASPQRFSAAATHYKSILDKINDSVRKEEVLLNYGVCLYKINQSVDAINILQNLTKESKNENIITDAYQYLALCFEKENNVKESLKTLESSLVKYPIQKNKIFIHKECARLYQVIQDIPSATKHLNLIYSELNDADSKAEILYQLAGFDLKSGLPNASENAQDKLKKILKDHTLSPIAPKTAFLLGQIHLSSNNLTMAMPYFEKIFNEYQDNEIKNLSYIELGNYFYLANDFIKANDNYKNVKFPVSNEQPKKYEDLKESVLIKKSDSQFQLKQFSSAKDEYMNLIRMNQNNSFYKIRYVKSCLESKSRIAEAISILNKIPPQDQTKETELLLEKLKELETNIRK